MSSTSDSRGITIVLSIDCVNADLLDQWTADGTLPELARLRKQGVCGNIQCPLGSVEGDWFSLYTGCLPSWHGHISYDEIIPGTYRSNTTIGSRAAVDPFWIVASDAGRQVTVINAPHIERSSIVHGIQIESWLTHDAGHYAPCTAYPPILKDELLRRAPTVPDE